MKVTPLALEGALLIETTVYADDRGFFTETYNQELWAKRGLAFDFVQDNHSFSKEAGTIRGLHYQLAPMAQTKLVRVVQGAIYDVIVDLRKASPTFGKWEGIILNASHHRQLLVPRGFAHGFFTLVPNTEVLYKVDAPYSKAHDRGILWSDPALAIPWPGGKVVLSEKDQQHPLLSEAEYDF